MAGMGDSCWAGLIPCCFGGRRGAARGEEDSEYLGSSLMGGATGAVKGAPTSTRRGALRRARDTLDGLRGKGKKHVPELHYLEISTHLVPKEIKLTQQQSSSFQPELKQSIIDANAEVVTRLRCEVAALQSQAESVAELQCAIGVLQAKLLQAVHDESAARRRAVRAELQELPHGEHTARGDMEVEADREWKELVLTFKAPGTNDTDGADERVNAQSTSACAAVPCGVETSNKVVLNGTEYSILSLLGQGGQGKVFKVTSHGAFGAMKTERCSKGLHANLVTEQLDWALGLEHKNVLPTWGYTTRAVSELELLIISVMPLGDNTLTELIRQKKMTDEVKYDICIGVADGVSYINEKGLVHGDLDHSNVLLANGVPKICDWGTMLKCGTTLGFMGKLETAAPEKVHGYQMANSKEAPPPVPASATWDVFALGLLAHSVFAGTQPAMRENVVSLITNMLAAKLGKADPDYVQKNPAEFHNSVQDNVARMLNLYATIPEKWLELHAPCNVPQSIGQLMLDCCEVQPELRPTAKTVALRLRQAAECTAVSVMPAP
eukprot:TRINITY_DN9890_c0_g1_i5.p1 TRINITY_DN9890_c0_g1~~TRINITY_DN9890_c0_g1_i5.p1  ORF type:complete len:580 (+),score=163.37 TRINITY_DN9890_c0_g1_i5:88-1740(+)